MPSEHYFAIGKYQQMIFCTPKEKVTHCVKEILNDVDGDGNGDKKNKFLSPCSSLFAIMTGLE